MVELFECDLREENRQSSKGNQLKWSSEANWYKADFTGYEGLSEYLVSHLLVKSSLLPDEYVTYKTEQIKYRNRIYLGCKSVDFLADSEQLITLERLYKNYSGRSLYTTMFTFGNVNDRLHFLVNTVTSLTGIHDFGIYISKLLTIDALFLNEDRHLHNIALIRTSSGEYKLSPIFDQGAALLSDTTLDYPLDEDVYSLMANVHSKTISFSFNEQLDAVEEIFGDNIHFSFTKSDVSRLLDQEPYYPKDIKNRVRTVIFEKMRQYPYLFS